MSSGRTHRDEILMILKDMICNTLKDTPVNVYLFGSWARVEEKKTSDIDIALQSKFDIPSAKWVELQEIIEETVLGLQMVNDRNLTSHTYNEILVNEIFIKTPNYYQLLHNWLERINAKL